MNKPLLQYLSSQLAYQEDKVLNQFENELRELYADSLEAIIFYGSCMRSREYQDSVLDFYVVVIDIATHFQVCGMRY